MMHSFRKRRMFSVVKKDVILKTKEGFSSIIIYFTIIVLIGRHSHWTRTSFRKDIELSVLLNGMQT